MRPTSQAAVDAGALPVLAACLAADVVIRPWTLPMILECVCAVLRWSKTQPSLCRAVVDAGFARELSNPAYHELVPSECVPALVRLCLGDSDALPTPVCELPPAVPGAKDAS